MAGTIPGVESARRRRFRGSTGGSDSSFVINSTFGSRRSRVFNDTHFNSTSFLQRSMVNQSDEDGKLRGEARKAKERLDGRLRGHRNSQERSRDANLAEQIGRKPSTSMVVGDLQMEVFGLKKSGSKRFNWGKFGLNWKASDQDECPVCLEKFKVFENLARLSCAHRFHSVCLLPWLENSPHCPCCRMCVLGSK